MKIYRNLTLLGILVAVLGVTPMSSKLEAKNKKTKKIVLSKNNTVVLNDEINGESVAEVITKIKQLDNPENAFDKVFSNKKEPIYLFLRSPGGEVQAGLEMLEAFKGLERPIDTITMFAASMAFQTAQQLGNRYIVKNGLLMSHRAQGGFSGEFGGQKPSQIDSRKGFWEQRIEEMDKQTVERTKGKQTLESYQKAYSPELWLTGTQAVEQGYADEIVSVQCDNTLKGVTTKTISFLGLIDIDYDIDDCPLNSTPMNVRIKKISTNKGDMSLADFSAKGGSFGTSCLVASGTDKDKVCAMDVNLSLEKLNDLKNKFKTYYMDINSRVIPYKL